MDNRRRVSSSSNIYLPFSNNTKQTMPRSRGSKPRNKGLAYSRKTYMMALVSLLNPSKVIRRRGLLRHRSSQLLSRRHLSRPSSQDLNLNNSQPRVYSTSSPLSLNRPNNRNRNLSYSSNHPSRSRRTSSNRHHNKIHNNLINSPSKINHSNNSIRIRNK